MASWRRRGRRSATWPTCNARPSPRASKQSSSAAPWISWRKAAASASLPRWPSWATISVGVRPGWSRVIAHAGSRRPIRAELSHTVLAGMAPVDFRKLVAFPACEPTLFDAFQAVVGRRRRLPEVVEIFGEPEPLA